MKQNATPEWIKDYYEQLEEQINLYTESLNALEKQEFLEFFIKQLEKELLETRNKIEG